MREAVMGKMIMVVIAFFVGAAALSGAQRLWISAMQARMDDVAASQKDWLPPPNPVVLEPNEDFQRMMTNPGVIPATHR
jgi:hypothetical protein